MPSSVEAGQHLRGRTARAERCKATQRFGADRQGSPASFTAYSLKEIVIGRPCRQRQVRVEVGLQQPTFERCRLHPLLHQLPVGQGVAPIVEESAANDDVVSEQQRAWRRPSPRSAPPRPRARDRRSTKLLRLAQRTSYRDWISRVARRKCATTFRGNNCLSEADHGG